MHKNMSLGSHVVLSLRKIPTRVRGTNFCTSSECFAPSFVRQLNSPKCTQMVQNAPKHEFRVQWGWIGCVRCEQFWCNFMARTFRNKSTRSTPLDPKLMFWCVSYHRVRSLRKIPTRRHGTNFCTSLAYFTPSFVRQPNGPKYTQIVGNTTKHEFRVQWGGSGAFVV